MSPCLTQRLREQPQFEFATQYAPVGKGWNTVIGFFNYFGQVFRQTPTAVKVQAVFFDAQGQERASHEVAVKANDAVQIDARALGVESDGLVAVRAIPEIDIHTLADGKVKLRKHIGTGFYVSWEHDGGFRDVMHEWNAATPEALKPSTQYAGFRAHADLTAQGLILMCPVLAERSNQGEPLSHPCIEVLDARGKTLHTMHAAVPSMGTTQIELSMIPAFAQQMREAGQAVVKVSAAQLAGAFTREQHRSGDFHIHHL